MPERYRQMGAGFWMAQEEAVSQLVKDYGKLDPVVRPKVAKDDVLFARSRPGPGENDAAALIHIRKP